MNYYIQGNAAKADKIKAAFEKLGYDISWPEGCANPDVINIGVERNGTKYVVAETAEYIKGIIKTHPDYKELELLVEPKFKVGDWIVFNGLTLYINEIVKGYYRTISKGGIINSYDWDIDNLARLWTIEDAKDGDVLCTYDDDKPKIVFIYKDGDRVLLYHCFHNMLYTLQSFVTDEQSGCLAPNGKVKPATKEQRDLLFAKMREAGYQWDTDKKELHKIQPHYDIANFHAGMPVLVRNNNDCPWYLSYYGYYRTCVRYKFSCVNGYTWKQCIPFNKETKHLLGTIEPCPEEFINW